MREYHKINTVYKRDPATGMKTLVIGDYSEPAFEYLARNEWIFTEKVDGTNIRVKSEVAIVDHTQLENRVSFGGKTDAASIPAILVARLQERFLPQADLMHEIFPDGACLYGEGYGARIQKGGGNYRADQDFVLFDVRVGEFWLQRDAVEDVASKLGIDVVPIIGKGTLLDMVEMARGGFNSTWGDFTAEGIVAKPACELRTRHGSRIITKIKHKDFAAERAAA